MHRIAEPETFLDSVTGRLIALLNPKRRISRWLEPDTMSPSWLSGQNLEDGKRRDGDWWKD